MSQYYQAKRTKNIYKPGNQTPFKLSRSKIDLFVECPRCFYLDRRLGVGRPPGFPFSLNSAVDKLLKQEFDIHRATGSRHPLIAKYDLDARPVAHPKLNSWRENFIGVQYHHEPTNFIITGAIDDLWIDSQGNYLVVDYKSTAKDEQIIILNKEWHAGYKRQMEIYQWLLRKNGLTVSDTGYFVYCNGRTDRQAFDGKLEFDITLIPYAGHDDWIEQTLLEIKSCLLSNKIPTSNPNCDYCAYYDTRYQVENETPDSLF
ncbi:MAG TPA: PD-(D/E)XK nuclease family protein [bacterium]|nr:PD-(D/E)XK nuclease family protein [bacterium]